MVASSLRATHSQVPQCLFLAEWPKNRLLSWRIDRLFWPCCQAVARINWTFCFGVNVLVHVPVYMSPKVCPNYIEKG